MGGKTEKNASFEEKNRKKQKKNGKFFAVDLKKIQICCIVLELFAGICLCGAENVSAGKIASEKKNLAEIERLKAEITLLQEEKKVIRRELLETLDKNTMLTGKLKQMELSIASVTESLSPVYAGEREEELVESLRTVMQSSAALASSVSSLCEEVLSLLEQREITSVRAAKIRVMINNLKNDIRSVERYQKTSSFPQGTDTCRILNTDDKLKAAVFSSGHRSGFRAGMILRTEDGSAKFQVVLLKEFTSVGLLVSGDLRSVSIGTRVITTSEKTAK